MKIRKKTVAETFAELDEKQKEYVYGLIREGLERGVFPNPNEADPIFRSCTYEQRELIRKLIKISSSSPDVA